MAASDFINTVQGMYVAYYGRFADQTGLTYWSQQLSDSSGNLTQIINSFGNSSEANGIYGSLTNDAKIEALYQNLFGHAADAAGKNYYAGLLSTGAATGADIAKRILDGASGDDGTILQSKLSAANNLTNTVVTSEYSGDAAVTAAHLLIADVTSPVTAANATATAFSTALENFVHPIDTLTTASTSSLDSNYERTNWVWDGYSWTWNGNDYWNQTGGSQITNGVWFGSGVQVSGQMTIANGVVIIG